VDSKRALREARSRLHAGKAHLTCVPSTLRNAGRIVEVPGVDSSAPLPSSVALQSVLVSRVVFSPS
jgi:hypothetical protein